MILALGPELAEFRILSGILTLLTGGDLDVALADKLLAVVVVAPVEALVGVVLRGPAPAFVHLSHSTDPTAVLLGSRRRRGCADGVIPLVLAAYA